MEMDIASLSMSMHEASLASQISMSVLNLAMDTIKTESSSMLDVLNASDPNRGKNLDVLV